MIYSIILNYLLMGIICCLWCKLEDIKAKNCIGFYLFTMVIWPIPFIGAIIEFVCKTEV